MLSSPSGRRCPMADGSVGARRAVPGRPPARQLRPVTLLTLEALLRQGVRHTLSCGAEILPTVVREVPVALWWPDGAPAGRSTRASEAREHRGSSLTTPTGASESGSVQHAALAGVCA